MKTKVIKTKDTYEAAFYILWGGRLADVHITVLDKKKANKLGYSHQWTMVIDNIPAWCFEYWKTDRVYGCISDYVKCRNRLKKQVKNLIKVQKSL